MMKLRSEVDTLIKALGGEGLSSIEAEPIARNQQPQPENKTPLKLTPELESTLRVIGMEFGRMTFRDITFDSDGGKEVNKSIGIEVDEPF